MRLEKSGHGKDLEALTARATSRATARATAPEWVTDTEEPMTRAMAQDWAGSGVAGERETGGRMQDLGEIGGKGEAAHIMLAAEEWRWRPAKM